jgi:histone H3/H4
MQGAEKAKVATRVDCPDDVHNIIGAALFALGHGAKGVWINLPAIQKFRSQFVDRVRSALEEPNWQANWQKEKVYLLAQAEAMGQRAARLAAEDGRAFITPQDIETAMMKVRSRMPIAGRWCPL